MRRFLQAQQLPWSGPPSAMKFDQLLSLQNFAEYLSGWETQDLSIYMAERTLLLLLEVQM